MVTKKEKLIEKYKDIVEQLKELSDKELIGKCYVKRVNYPGLEYTNYFRVLEWKGYNSNGKELFLCERAFEQTRPERIIDIGKGFSIERNEIDNAELITFEAFKIAWNSALKAMRK